MVIVTGTVQARPDSLDALRAACVAHSARSRAEAGCVSHAVHVDCENPLRLFFFELWADRAALEAHFRHKDSAIVMKAIRELAADSEGPVIYEAA